MVANFSRVFDKVAIIGCGYVGTALARYWQKKGHLVTATTTRQERVAKLEEVAAQVVVMKGHDAKAVQSIIQNQDTVLISVAPVGDRQVDAKGYEETYLPTVRNLVAALRDASTVKQLIYLSSCAIYGDKNGKWVDEASPADTNSEYNKVLYEAEQVLLHSAIKAIKVCILRLGGIYGPGRELTKRIGRFAGETLPGSGENIACWIHLDDIIAAVEFVRQNRLDGIYNLVNDLHRTNRDLFDHICDRQGLPRVSWDATKPSFSSLNACVDNQKIKAAGYKLIYPDTIV
ncbi:SDR family oxidoreductase [Pleurocapsales cyanobacterium LEGE 06147]|nr:SDR family oxidoreductase [Pleurocapsales cyanobacterium LEGE 06147]